MNKPRILWKFSRMEYPATPIISAPMTDPNGISDDLDPVQEHEAAAEQQVDGEDIQFPAPQQRFQPRLATSPAQTVGIFDSGIGGFTVAKAIRDIRPDLSIIYFADSINLPYGGRSQEQLERFARNTVEFLVSRGAGILAIGCNASNSALGQSGLHSFGIPAFDLVGSTVDWLKGQYGLPERLVLLATEATVRARYWERKLQEAFPSMQVQGVSAPSFVPLIEAQEQDETAIRRAVRAVVQPLVADGERTILFGCTHYPLLAKYIREVESEIQFIDPADCLARKLAAGVEAAAIDAPPGRLTFFSSMPSERFLSMGERIFGRSIRELTRMYLVNPHEGC